MSFSRSLQRQVIPHFCLAELSECRRQPFARLWDHLFRCRDRHDANLDRLLRHFALKAFLEREKRSVDGIFERDFVVVPGEQPMRSARTTRCRETKLTASPKTSLRWSWTCRSRSPSMPKRIRTGRPDRAIDHDGHPIRRSRARRHMDERHCRVQASSATGSAKQASPR